MPDTLKITLRCLLLVLVQVWILDQVVLYGTWIVLFLYPLAIVKLPVSYTPIQTMLVGFLVGIVVDIFTGTYGLHASSGLIIGYARPRIIRLISSREELEENLQPDIFSPNLRWFFLLLLGVTLVHSFWYFNVSQFQLSSFFKIQLRAFLSAFCSFILAMLIEVLFASKKRRK